MSADLHKCDLVSSDACGCGKAQMMLHVMNSCLYTMYLLMMADSDYCADRDAHNCLERATSEGFLN